MVNSLLLSIMKHIYDVYNLEFGGFIPDHFTLLDHEFMIRDDYDPKSLHRLNSFRSNLKMKNVVTMTVTLEENNEGSSLFFDEGKTLHDIAMLLSVLTGRNVYFVAQNQMPSSSWYPVDPRRHRYTFAKDALLQWGHRLYKDQCNDRDWFECYFENMYTNLKTAIKNSSENLYLDLYLDTVKQHDQRLAFIHATTLIEHIFSIDHTDKKSESTCFKKKAKHIFSQYLGYDFRGSDQLHQIDDMAKIRNRLIHVGRRPPISELESGYSIDFLMDRCIELASIPILWRLKLIRPREIRDVTSLIYRYVHKKHDIHVLAEKSTEGYYQSYFMYENNPPLLLKWYKIKQKSKGRYLVYRFKEEILGDPIEVALEEIPNNNPNATNDFRTLTVFKQIAT
jgi:hypothetical protein